MGKISFTNFVGFSLSLHSEQEQFKQSEWLVLTSVI